MSEELNLVKLQTAKLSVLSCLQTKFIEAVNVDIKAKLLNEACVNTLHEVITAKTASINTCI